MMDQQKPGLHAGVLTVHKVALAKPSVVLRVGPNAPRVPGFDPAVHEELRRRAAEGRLKPLTRDNIEEAIALARN